MKNVFKGNYTGPIISDLREALRQITSGLAHLHLNEILHRDLRPSNIVIFCPSSSPAPVMKLANFGIVRVTKPGDMVVLSLWKLAGSKGWLPPETYTNSFFTMAMDLFALGCIFGSILNYIIIYILFMNIKQRSNIIYLKVTR